MTGIINHSFVQASLFYQLLFLYEEDVRILTCMGWKSHIRVRSKAERERERGGGGGGGVAKSNFIADYWYVKVNILVPENLLWDTSILRYPKLKCKEKLELVRTIPPAIRVYFEISLFEIMKINCILHILTKSKVPLVLHFLSKDAL